MTQATTFSRAKRFALGLALAASLLSTQRSQAAEIIEMGANYHVIAYEAGGGEAGWVVLRVEYPVMISGQAKVRTTIADVWPAPGWAYLVRKAGGIDASVEVDFANANCAARFRAVYKPGKTVVDGGQLSCR